LEEEEDIYLAQTLSYHITSYHVTWICYGAPIRTQRRRTK